MTTTETAKAIVEFAGIVHLGSRTVTLSRTVHGTVAPSVSTDKPLPLADVTAMAKLWLMLPEIQQVAQKSADRLGNHQNAKALLTALAALEGE